MTNDTTIAVTPPIVMFITYSSLFTISAENTGPPITYSPCDLCLCQIQPVISSSIKIRSISHKNDIMSLLNISNVSF